MYIYFVFSAVLMEIVLNLTNLHYFGFCCIHLFVKILNYIVDIKI